MGDLNELVERVKAADRELDYAISRFADGELARHSSLHLPYTASIDAALALTERMLPEANCCGVEKDPSGWCAYVSRNNVASGHWLKEAYAPTAPLALLAALLTALSLDTNKGDGV